MNFLQVWLQMLAAKLEKVNQEKTEKTQKLGNIIDKVVSVLLRQCYLGIWIAFSVLWLQMWAKG